MHTVIFPSWSCQLSCHYCSIRNSKIDRSVKGVPWTQWAEVLPTVLPHGSIVDIAGGEPLIYEGIVDLLHSIGNAGLLWAITTNGKALDVVERICKEKPIGGVCFNLSDHKGNPESVTSKNKLRNAGYNVNIHRVDHPHAGYNHSDASLIPYQDWLVNDAVDGIERRCTAGQAHWIADPSGDLWRCIVAAETGQPSFGNLFTGERKYISTECTFGCSSCYIGDSASWAISMEIM